MARSKNTPAPAGHNIDPLTDDETAALQHYFASKIRKQRLVYAQAKALADEERDEINALFTSARAELRYTRKEFEEVLALQDLSEAEFLHHEAKRHARLANSGLPVGTLLDMFAQDTATDQAQAYQNGYRAGVCADDPVPPSTVSPILHPDWLKGWHEGQTFNLETFAKGAEIINARRAAADAPGPNELSAEEPEDGDEDDGVDADLRALEAKGWTQPTAAEAEMATA